MTEHRRARYFMLSYAHSPPLTDQRPGELDQWVRRFFDDLNERVGRYAGPRSGLHGGFFDQLIPLGSDWKAALTGALETAETFVPLYSPAYFSRTQSGREWECFHHRMLRAGLADPMSRFVPVLWTPVLGDQHRTWARDVPTFGAAAPGYADHGLRALLRLKVYERDYRAVVGLLAERIVAVAEGAPVGPSAVADLDGLASPFQAEANPALFAVTVAAPGRAEVPAGRNDTGYGAHGTDWRPFPDEHELSLASYAAVAAERLDFAVVITRIEKSGDDMRDKPGIVLIDPWFVRRNDGARALHAFMKGLPPWVLPIVVRDAADDARTMELAGKVMDILRDAWGRHSETARRPVREIGSFREFVALMPFLITEAERQYLRKSSLPRGRVTKPEPRPRLSRDPRAVPGGESDA